MCYRNIKNWALCPWTVVEVILKPPSGLSRRTLSLRRLRLLSLSTVWTLLSMISTWILNRLIPGLFGLRYVILHSTYLLQIYICWTIFYFLFFGIGFWIFEHDESRVWGMQKWVRNSIFLWVCATWLVERGLSNLESYPTYLHWLPHSH